MRFMTETMTNACADSPTVPPPSSKVLSSGRIAAVDSAKGIGILLVVFGHAWRGAQGAGLISDTALFRAVDFAVYAFHMPLFFFLSGLLILETLQKYPAGILLRGRVSRLLWPMALWSWIFFGVKFLAGPAVNSPVALADFPLVPLPPYEHLWFLWALFLGQSMLILAHAFALHMLPPAVLRQAAGVAAVGLALVNPSLSVPSVLFGPLVEHLPYLLAGIAVGGLAARRPSGVLAMLCAVAFAGLLWALGGQKASVLHSLALVLLACIAWRHLDNGRAEDGLLLRGLRYLGQISMVVYLTHTIFSAAVRIGMVSLGLADPLNVLLWTTVVGIVAPIALLWSVRRMRLTKVLGF